MSKRVAICHPVKILLSRQKVIWQSRNNFGKWKETFKHSSTHTSYK